MNNLPVNPTSSTSKIRRQNYNKQGHNNCMKLPLLNTNSCINFFTFPARCLYQIFSFPPHRYFLKDLTVSKLSNITETDKNIRMEFSPMKDEILSDVITAEMKFYPKR